MNIKISNPEYILTNWALATLKTDKCHFAKSQAHSEINDSIYDCTEWHLDFYPTIILKLTETYIADLYIEKETLFIMFPS